MTPEYDWAGFYQTLCERGAQLLRGIDEETRGIITLTAETDSFWSDGLQSVLGESASSGDVRAGVIDTVQLWRENVLTVLTGDYGIDLEWAEVTVDTSHPVIDDLVRSAQPSS